MKPPGGWGGGHDVHGYDAMDRRSSFLRPIGAELFLLREACGIYGVDAVLGWRRLWCSQVTRALVLSCALPSRPDPSCPVLPCPAPFRFVLCRAVLSYRVCIRRTASPGQSPNIFVERTLAFTLGYLFQSGSADGAEGGTLLKTLHGDAGGELALAIKLRADNDFYSQTSQASLLGRGLPVMPHWPSVCAALARRFSHRVRPIDPPCPPSREHATHTRQRPDGRAVSQPT